MFENYDRDATEALTDAQDHAGQRPLDLDDLFAALCADPRESILLLRHLNAYDTTYDTVVWKRSMTVANRRFRPRSGAAQKPLAERVRLSEAVIGVVELANAEAAATNSRVGSRHLLLALARHGGNAASRFLHDNGLGYEKLRRFVAFAPAMLALDGLCVSAGADLFTGRLRGTTSTAIRDRETRRLCQVLSRRTRSNVVLVGDPGVGKTTMLYDLARLFAERQVPRTLAAKELFRVSWSNIQHEPGRGESRAESTITAPPRDLSHCFETAARHRRVVLALDDVAEHVDITGQIETGGALAMLWRQLADNALQVILTMSPVEYSQFAGTSPLDRYFEPIRVPEPSPAQTVVVLNAAAREPLQQHHSVVISDDAVEAAANLADRYIADQFLPSKAITLLDEACASAQAAETARPSSETEAIVNAPPIVDGDIVRGTLADLKGIPISELLSATFSAPPTTSSTTLMATAPATTRLPHRLTSTAVLLGAAHYDHPALPDTPTITNNLLSLHRRLTDPEHGSFSPDRVHQSDGDLDTPHIPALVKATRTAMDTLLVYYCGHGFIADDGQLHLGLTSTNPDLWEYTALPYEKLRKAVRDAPARNKILILDCCFAGRAIDDLSDGDTPSGQLDIDGTYVLTATTATRTAHASDGADNTAFTGALLHVLGEGVDEREELIRLSAIYSRLDQRLIAKGLPKPQQRGTNNIHNLALTRNPRWNRNLSS